jgi:sterol desaturase/sphingolipid hydroxylase (fatty acid hydroxylase superfamily)
MTPIKLVAHLTLMASSVDGFIVPRQHRRPAQVRVVPMHQKIGLLSLSTVALSSRPRGPLTVKKNVQAVFQKLTHSLKTNEVTQWRAVALTFFTSVLVFHKAIDHQLAQFWQYLLYSQSVAGRMFRTDSYEWCLAVGCFVFYIHAFWLADRLVRTADRRGRAHPWKKYRLQDQYEAAKQSRRQQENSGSNDVVAKDSSVVKVNDDVPILVNQSPWNSKAWSFELLVYCVPLLIWDIVAPRRHRRLAPFGAPTTMRILGGISMGLVLYDFLFFCGHLLLHKAPFLYRTVHAKHHTVSEPRAGDTVRLSLVEEVLEVGFSIIALNILSVHPLARSIYNCVITFLLTELHCGFDLPWTPQNIVPFGLATGSRRHHYHHRNGKHYYQKFFFTFDRLFGFFQKNDGSLHGDSVQPVIAGP